MKLRVQPHLKMPGASVVEILSDSGELIGAIYAQPRGVKIVSKYIENRPDLVVVDPITPPAVIVNLID